MSRATHPEPETEGPVLRVPLRRIPSTADDPPGTVRDRVLQGALAQHAIGSPSELLWLVTPRETVLASLASLRDRPSIPTVLGMKLLGRIGGSRCFRTGVAGGGVAVLELNADGAWWLATWSAEVSSLVRRRGHGNLPEPVGHWWPRSSDVPAARIVVHEVTPPPVEPLARIRMSQPATDWTALVPTLPELLRAIPAQPDPLGIALAGTELTAWTLPDHHLGGGDEALRAIAWCTGADLIARLERRPGARRLRSTDGRTCILVDVVVENRHTRLSALVAVFDERARVVHAREREPVDPAGGWHRPPLPAAAQLRASAGLLHRT